MPQKKIRHINIPIFIPHLGCPNSCVFCNQRTISGHGDFDIASVRGELETALATVERDCRSGEYDCEIAFFGGSFTGIERADMLYLLGLASEYVSCGRVKSIRLSTRPDYIDGEILDILASYPVKSIELGLQSFSDRVLTASKRGHTSACAIEACERIKARGFDLTGQMMVALPESELGDELYTAREIARLCDSARIYPTVVFRATELYERYLRGEYEPPELEEIIARTAAVLEVFVQASKPVLRIGLHSSDNLSDPEEAVAGAVHPALGELVMGELCYVRLCRMLEACTCELCGRDIRIAVPRSEVSKAIGQKRRNIARLESRFGAHIVVVGADNVPSLMAPGSPTVPAIAALT